MQLISVVADKSTEKRHRSIFTQPHGSVLHINTSQSHGLEETIACSVLFKTISWYLFFSFHRIRNILTNSCAVHLTKCTVRSGIVVTFPTGALDPRIESDRGQVACMSINHCDIQPLAWVAKPRRSA